MKKLLFFSFTVISLGLNAQGLVNSTLQQNHHHESEGAIGPQCGSHLLMKNQDKKQPGLLNASNKALQNIVENLDRSNKTTSATLTIPVVFHIVYNNADENLPDSVIQHQLRVLNDNYRRQNADTTSLRPAFRPYAGNPNIQFELATTDPNGNPTNGIVRTSTDIQHFGGILPYNINQQSQIQQWVNDSLFYNLFRISQDSLGGSDAWDTDKYLNIWVGDLRIFEPQIQNFEELVFLGLAQPPANHPNFVGTGFDTLIYDEGVLMHYVAIGPNNPISYPAPYAGLNNTLADGDLVSHEVGHYLGLRHIWGDGDCTADDFIFDTPLSNNSNQFSCNKNRNTCVDSIDGVDLPDMVENFMDYSSDACLNSFTQEQAAVMRATLFTYRPNLFTIGQEELPLAESIECFPNPSSGHLKLSSTAAHDDLEVKVYNSSGALILVKSFSAPSDLELYLEGPKGLYLVQVNSAKDQVTFRILKN